MSGFHFIHHIFDESLALIRFHSKSDVDKLEQVHDHGLVVESRVSVLEQQFMSFKSKSDLDFAIQQELNDWQENQTYERYFVLTGLPAAPNKLSGG